MCIRDSIVIDHRARFGEFLAEMLPLVRDGSIVAPATYVAGLENAPGALMDILRPNATTGKVLVRLE